MTNQPTYLVANVHDGTYVYQTTTDPSLAHDLAHAAAELGHDALYQMYLCIGEYRHQFICQFSVLRGHVTMLLDVVIPQAHYPEREDEVMHDQDEGDYYEMAAHLADKTPGAHFMSEGE